MMNTVETLLSQKPMLGVVLWKIVLTTMENYPDNCWFDNYLPPTTKLGATKVLSAKDTKR